MDSRPDPNARLLIALLALAAAIRLPLAVWPNIIHPDEIYQYLDPAWRVLGHEGVVSWEWRYGMRGWLVPSVLAGPMAFGDWLAPGGTAAFVGPRLLAALASLSIVASGWWLGARVSRIHGFVAALVATVWFEFVLFAPHTLGEPLATALILPAALLITQTGPPARHLPIGGALLAFALIIRIQYAPAIAVLALGACWGRWRLLAPLFVGGLIALIPAGAADLTNGTVPFSWVAAYVHQNFLLDRAAGFGVMPALTYISSFGQMWSLAIVALVPAILFGARHAPLLLLTALVNIAFHALIGHKEYRFIYLSVVLLILLAALGSADWIVRLRALTKWRRWAVPVGAAVWLVSSIVLGSTGVMPGYWMNGVAASRLAQQVRQDPQLCGLALYDVPVPLLPGRARLSGASPIYAFDPADPEGALDLAAAMAQRAASFNRILAPQAAARQMPAGFSERDCGEAGGIATCIFARDGTCMPSDAQPFILNDVLTRVDR